MAHCMVWVLTRNGYFGRGNTTRLSSFTSINTNVDTLKTHSGAAIVHKFDKTLWVAGQNTWSSLGVNNNASNVTTWTQVGALANNTIIAYALSNGGSWIISQNNTDPSLYTVRASGLSSNGNLGNGSTSSTGVILSSIKTLPISDSNVEILSSALNYGGCAVKTANSLYMCGVNTYGKLGRGNTTNSDIFVTPINAPSIANIKLFCSGECMAAYMDNQGYVYLSGYHPESNTTTVSDYNTSFKPYHIPSMGI